MMLSYDDAVKKILDKVKRYTHWQEIEGGYWVTLNIAEKVGMLASMAAANSLTIIPEGSVVKAGDKIRVLPLDWRRGQPLL